MMCPRCGGRRFWILKDERRRCARCRSDWRPERLPLRLTPRQWRALLRWFVRGLPSAQIAHETRLDRKRVLRALLVVRRAMARSISEAVSLDNGGARARLALEDETRPARGLRPPRRVAAFGLRASGTFAWAEVVPDVDTDGLARALRDRKGDGPFDWAGAHRYAAVAYGGRLYRLAESARAPFGHVESFWAYLQRRLKAKGGIRRKRLGLYLAEYAWRYNHRKLSPPEQLRELLKVIRRNRYGVGNTTYPVRREHDSKGGFH